MRKAAVATLAVLVLTSTALAQGATRITLDQAIDLALTHNHTLKAARTLTLQSRAQETTAALRPNPQLAWDALFFPLNPSDYTLQNFLNTQQFDMGVSYVFERGGKRQRRLEAAKDATSVTSYQVSDTERSLIFNVAQQFINAQLATSNLEFAQKDLQSFQQTVDISQQRYRAGDMSEGDFLKIKLQLLQFQTDVSTAQVAKVQALASLRQLLGYDAVPANYEIAEDMTYQPLSLNLDDLRNAALKSRPDFLGAQAGIRAAQSQVALAKANGKVDLTGSLSYSHLADQNSLSTAFSVPLPIFDRNQGEIARTRFAYTQAQEQADAASDTVLTDVRNSYEAVQTNQQILQLYLSGYLKQAKDSRDISEYAYQHGGASLLDYLDAERSYRAIQLAYRQSLADYLFAVEQLKQSVGVRKLP